MEQLLSKFVQKAQALTHLTSGNIKQSATVSRGFPDLASAKLEKRFVTTVNTMKPLRKSKSDQYDDPHILRMLSGVPLTRHTINEAKLAKLNSIISVLRETVDDSSEGESQGGHHGGGEGSNGGESPPIPEFTSIFRMDKKVEEEKKQPKENGKRRQKRRSRPPRTMLHALREDLADNELSSDSGDNHDDDTSPVDSFNDQSMAWLASQKTNSGRGGDSWARPQSDSFQVIRKLRESLNAGGRNKISNYTFENPLGVQRVAEKGVDMEDHKERKEQMHYKLVDTKSQAEEDPSVVTSPRPFSMPAYSSPSEVSSPDCKCYPVPVEVSIHRISVVDVDKEREEQMKADVIRTRSVETKPPVGGHERIGRRKPMGERIPVKFGKTDNNENSILLRPPSGKRKTRSRSLGDMECLSSDEEVLLIRTPFTGQLNIEAASRVPILSEQNEGTGSKFETVNSQFPVSPGGPGAMSSLDYTTRPETSANNSPTSPSSPTFISSSPTIVRREKVERPRLALSVRMEDGNNHESWVLGSTQPREGKSLLKYRSLDNLIDSNVGKRK